MNIDIAPGTYVVAVSGGVDSMVLLYLLKKQTDCRLIVAHYDHGIRPESHLDQSFVASVAETFGLPFLTESGALGPEASEEMARNARYDFLKRVVASHGATAMVTAHHQDDVLETALINLHRGTGRRGLTALSSRPDVVRPLLDYSKKDIVAFAKDHDIAWREDYTNEDERYLRNYLRHQVVEKLSEEQRAELVRNIRHLRQINHDLDQEITDYLEAEADSSVLDRKRFCLLPDEIAKEVMAYWLRSQGIASFDKKTLQRLVEGAGTLHHGKQVEITAGRKLLISRDTLALDNVDR